MFGNREGSVVLEHARAVLRSAEQRTGVRSRLEASVVMQESSLRLASVLPSEALPCGVAAAVTGSATFLTELVSATQGPGWVAVVGWPALGTLAMAQAGVALERTVIVPDVHGMGAQIVAALLDGVDQVVVGPDADLNPAQRRQLLARARRNDNTLVTSTPWEGSVLELCVQSVTWSGPDAGSYWLRRARYDVARRSKRDGRERRFTVTLEWPGFSEGRLAGALAEVCEVGSAGGRGGVSRTG